MIDDDFYDDDNTCPHCEGEGLVIDCCDDMCHGAGYCIHNSYANCPHCRGTGEIIALYNHPDTVIT